MAEKRKQTTLLNFCKKIRRNDEVMENITVVQNDPISVTTSTTDAAISKNICDIKLHKNKYLNSEEKLRLLNQFWKPDAQFSFPVNEKSKRSFQYSWFSRFSWLAYSEVENSVYCKYCLMFSLNEVGKSKQQTAGYLVEKGYFNWKHVLEYFANHQAAQYHFNSIFKYEHL